MAQREAYFCDACGKMIGKNKDDIPVSVRYTDRNGQVFFGTADLCSRCVERLERTLSKLAFKIVASTERNG